MASHCRDESTEDVIAGLKYCDCMPFAVPNLFSAGFLALFLGPKK